MRETCNHLPIRSHPGLQTAGKTPEYLLSHDSLAQPTCNEHAVALAKLETIAGPLRLKEGHTIRMCPSCFGDGDGAETAVVRTVCANWDEHGEHFENRAPPEDSPDDQ